MRSDQARGGPRSAEIFKSAGLPPLPAPMTGSLRESFRAFKHDQSVAAEIDFSDKSKYSECMSTAKYALHTLAVFACLTYSGRGADEPAGEQKPADYQTQIKPVLRERCFACHGALKQKGGLRLDTAAFAIKGGDSGPAIKPGDVADSLLLERVTAADESERMPPEGEPLKREQIEVLKQWIAQNAKAPADEKPERDPRDHWAFNPPVRPAVPTVDQPTPDQARWQLNPIDAFISAEHRQRNLVAQAPADKRVWLRRVSLDLIGLPPTPQELAAFVADQTPEAYDKVVTRLLDSPQY